MLRKSLMILLLLGMLSACAPAPVESPTPLPATPTPHIQPPTEEIMPTATTKPAIPSEILTIFSTEDLQVLGDVASGNFIHEFGGVHTATDPVSELNLNTLSPNVARVAIGLHQWEPRNDDGDPQNLVAEAFRDSPGTPIRGTFEFMQSFQQPERKILASVWRVPDWLVTNPGADHAQLIPLSLYPEAVESIAAWLVHARDVYGVKVDYVSFNEANWGVNVYFTPDEYAEFIRQAGKRFRELGLTTRWLLADTTSMAPTVEYAAGIWKHEDIRPFIGLFTFHSWDATVDDTVISSIGNFAIEHELDVWCTEAGWDFDLWNRPEELPGWQHALNLAAVYSRMLKLGRVTNILYWEMMGEDYNLNDGITLYPSLLFLEQLKKQFPPGATVVNTASDGQSIKYVAAKAADGFALLIVNQGPSALIEIKGLPPGSYSILRSNQSGSNVDAGTLAIQEQSPALELESESLYFVTTREP